VHAESLIELTQRGRLQPIRQRSRGRPDTAHLWNPRRSCPRAIAQRIKSRAPCSELLTAALHGSAQLIDFLCVDCGEACAVVCAGECAGGSHCTEFARNDQRIFASQRVALVQSMTVAAAERASDQISSS
jgi:hypothetical protein